MEPGTLQLHLQGPCGAGDPPATFTRPPGSQGPSGHVHKAPVELGTLQLHLQGPRGARDPSAAFARPPSSQGPSGHVHKAPVEPGTLQLRSQGPGVARDPPAAFEGPCGAGDPPAAFTRPRSSRGPSSCVCKAPIASSRLVMCGTRRSVSEPPGAGDVGCSWSWLETVLSRSRYCTGPGRTQASRPSGTLHC